MFGLAELKEKILIMDTTVECPVKSPDKGCLQKVKRQRNIFRCSDDFKCPIHKIYISPSTFEYESMWDNILWKRECEVEFWNRVRKVKRESRMKRDNSEDAVTWNIFRFLDNSHLIRHVMGQIARQEQNVNQIVYWSYSPEQRDIWDCLREARKEFETVPDRGSEPDIIVTTDKAIFFIEAKLRAGNNTTLSNKNVSKKYQSGGGNWFREAFSSDFDTIAVCAKKYELMRFWLLGTWIANKLNLEFYLVNLVRSRAEQNIESEFGPHIQSTETRKFVRFTWEQIFSEVLVARSLIEGKDEIIQYFRNKSIGYVNGKLKAAFAVQNV